MAISDRARKSLWAKAGNRCSICRTKLFSNNVDSEEFNIGEESHVMSSKEKGSRHKPNITDEDAEYIGGLLQNLSDYGYISGMAGQYHQNIQWILKSNHS